MFNIVMLDHGCFLGHAWSIGLDAEVMSVHVDLYSPLLVTIMATSDSTAWSRTSHLLDCISNFVFSRKGGLHGILCIALDFFAIIGDHSRSREKHR